MKQQCTLSALTTDEVMVDLYRAGEGRKMSLHDFIVVAEQVAATLGAVGLVHYIV